MRTLDAQWAEIYLLLRRFPKPSRPSWVRKAVDEEPNLSRLFTHDTNLASWLHDPTDPLQTIWPTDQVALIPIFHRSLIDFYQRARECASITRCLNTWTGTRKRNEWQQILQDSIGEHQRLLSLTVTNRVVSAWISTAPTGDKPPQVDGIVPPLIYDDLVCLRRSLDKHRKRETRAAGRNLPLFATSEQATVGTCLDAMSATEDIERLNRALEQLPEQDRAIVRLNADGMRQKDIAKLLGLSRPTICERLAASRCALRRLLTEDPPKTKQPAKRGRAITRREANEVALAAFADAEQRLHEERTAEAEFLLRNPMETDPTKP